MTKKQAFERGAILAAAVLALLFFGKLLSGDEPVSPQGNTWLNDSSGYGSYSRKNYASEKKLGGGNISPADAQKYEKVATIGQAATDFEADRARISALISSSGGLTQYEKLQGLAGRRTLQLGIGVPPSGFDSFIEDARKIAKVTHLEIVKTDKTREYRELRAKKESLEKTRKSLTDMAASGGSVDERLKVQAKLTEVEDKLQDLGVSLGDFNTENEFCTVNLTLNETGMPVHASMLGRTFRALVWSLEYFLYLGIALLLLSLAAWLGSLALAALVRAWTQVSKD
jgi:uncharacterized protein YfcZ (UPF0381/DUF406 family)